ncbi:MAG: diadenylate cyclase CdaA [Candidatus Fibromonas sp.]|nr:diadenylate cyclase CdaA [Candidatus Fibromonas sp.]
MFNEILDFKLFGVVDVRFSDIIDIFLISCIIYCFFLLFKGTRAVQMFFGVVLIVAVWFFALLFDLRGLAWLIGGLGALGVVAIVIVFQPEIRGMLTRIGQIANVFSIKTIFFKSSGLNEITNKIVEAILELQKKTHGALIVLEKRVGLKSYMDSGETINGEFSKKLLCTLFYPGTPLHDGAVVISRDKILAAGCVLPMPTGAAAAELSGGMRHRAAKALAAETDALIIVVSEETGYISIAYRNSFRTRQSKKELEEEIKRHWKELYED